MGSTIGHRIDYNGVGALRGHAATHTQQALTQVPPPDLRVLSLRSMAARGGGYFLIRG